MISSGFLGIVPIIIVIVLYFCGMPVAFALFSAGLVYFGVINTGSPVELIFQKFITYDESLSFLLFYKITDSFLFLYFATISMAIWCWWR